MSAVAWILGLFGLAALLLAVSRLVAARQLAAAGYAALAVLLVCASWSPVALAADLASYQPRDRDRPIAEIYFEQVGTARYRATVTRLPGGRMQVFELARDAWRLDARTIEFGGWARDRGPSWPSGTPRRGPTDLWRESGLGDGGLWLDARDGFDLWQASRRSTRWGELVSAPPARRCR